MLQQAGHRLFLRAVRGRGACPMPRSGCWIGGTKKPPCRWQSAFGVVPLTNTSSKVFGHSAVASSPVSGSTTAVTSPDGIENDGSGTLRRTP